VSLFCSGCGGAWVQAAAEEYRRHLGACDALAETLAVAGAEAEAGEEEGDAMEEADAPPPPTAIGAARAAGRRAQGTDATLTDVSPAFRATTLQPFQEFLALVRSGRRPEAEAWLQAWTLRHTQQHPAACRDLCRCPDCSNAIAWGLMDEDGASSQPIQLRLEGIVTGSSGPFPSLLPLYGLWRDRRTPCEDVEVVTVYLAPKGKSRRYGLPGMDQAAQRDHTLSRLYSQYDPLHRGVLLSLLQGGCPSDGFLYSAPELRQHALATAMHLCLFPNLRVVRCCSVLALRCLLPLLTGRRLGPGLARNHLGAPWPMDPSGTPLEGVWASPPVLVGMHHPQRYWQYGKEAQREAVRRADQFHRLQLGRWLKAHAPHLLHSQALAPEEGSELWSRYLEYGRQLPPLVGLWVAPPSRPMKSEFMIEEEKGEPAGDAQVGEDFYLPAAVASDPDTGAAATSLETDFAHLALHPPKMTPVPDTRLPGDLLADAAARLARTLGPRRSAEPPAPPPPAAPPSVMDTSDGG